MERAFCWDKFRKFSFIFQKIGNEDGAFVDAGLLFPTFRLGVRFVWIGQQPFEIGECGLEHCFTDAGLFAEEKIKTAEEIRCQPDTDDEEGVKEGQVPGEEDIIIPEGQKGLQVVLPRQRAAALVVDDGLRAGVNRKPHVADAPAEVDVFLVHIVIVIEAACLFKQCRAEAHAGTCFPE